jgi:hypothetical protein
MASPSADNYSNVTISDTTSSNFLVHVIPPAALDVQEEEIVCSMCILVDAAPLRIVPMEQRDHVKISKYEPNHGEQEVQVPVAEESCWLQTQNWRAFVCSRINGILI